MAHGAPRALGIGSKVRGAVLANNEARSFAGELEVHDAVLVHGRLDVVGVAGFVQGDCQVIGAKANHVLVKHEVRERVRVPDVIAIALKVEDLGVEVGCGVDAAISSNRDLTSQS